MDAVEPSRELRGELRSLPRDLADRVGGHLAAAERLLESDPEQAYAHARAAARRAGRLAIAREVCGTAAYATGRWIEAARELRAARRLGTASDLLPLIADCERGLGRPERALGIAASKDAARLGDAARIELLIVAAGARRDLGQVDAAVVLLQVPELAARTEAPWVLRLRYAYADLLEAAGRRDEAVSWFDRVAAADPGWQTDAADRAAWLRGDPTPARPRPAGPDDGNETEIVDLGD